MHFQCTQRGNHDNCIRLQVCPSAFHVQKLFCAQIGSEPCFRHNIVGIFECCFRCHYTIASMGNIGKRPSMNQGRRVFQCLNKIWFHCFFQKNSHCTFCMQLSCCNGFVFKCIPYQHIPEPFF